MFSYEEIQKYNETDICIYKYIVSNIDKVQYMTIRELAKQYISLLQRYYVFVIKIILRDTLILKKP